MKGLIESAAPAKTAVPPELRRKRRLLLSTSAAGARVDGIASLLQADGELARLEGSLPEFSEEASAADVHPETRAWMEAGALFERALEAERADVALCLDPWAAMAVACRARVLGTATLVRAYPDDAADPTGAWLRRFPFDEAVAETLQEWLCRVQAPSLRKTSERVLPTPATSADSSIAPELRSAYRNVFADSDEALVAVMAGGEGAELLAAVREAAEILSGMGRRARWVVSGVRNDPAWGQDPWVRLLPAAAEVDGLLAVADARVYTGEAPAEPVDAKAILPGARGHTGTSLADALRRILDASGIPESGNAGRRPSSLVLYNDWGIGDELLLSAVAREIVRARPDLRVWVRSRFGFRFPAFVAAGEPPLDATRVETIYQNPGLYGPRFHSPFPGHLVQQMLDKVFVDTGIKVKAEDVRPELEEIPGAPRVRDFATVIVHSRPNRRLPSKDWGLERWRRLCETLHERGIRPVQVGEKDEPVLPHALDRRGASMPELREVFLSAGGVVCLVGFLMHFAAATRTPAVVIYGGREHPKIDGYPDQVHLASGPLACRGRWGCHLPADVECAEGMRCMDELTPELVAEEVTNLLGTPACH